MLENNSTTEKYPKTLEIRNTKGGRIWQIYHVNNITEAKRLANNATRNGFESCSLVEYNPEFKETWPDWRETSGGRQITRID